MPARLLINIRDVAARPARVKINISEVLRAVVTEIIPGNETAAPTHSGRGASDPRPIDGHRASDDPTSTGPPPGEFIEMIVRTSQYNTSAVV